MELDRKSSGTAKAGLTTGIIGTSLGALGMLGGNLGLLGGAPVCSEDRGVNRYELAQEQKIAELQTQIALRDANLYNDQKSLELYKYVDGQFAAIQQQLAAQAVQNQANKDSFQIMQERMDCMKKECCTAIAAEAKERKCADNTIVTYANATFYPKMVADVTVGTTTTAQTLYNPLPVETCNCNHC